MNTPNQIILSLIYSENAEFIVGGFSTLDSAQTWVMNEKLKSSWVAGTKAKYQNEFVYPAVITIE